jgi:hypothetical protein
MLNSKNTSGVSAKPYVIGDFPLSDHKGYRGLHLNGQELAQAYLEYKQGNFSCWDSQTNKQWRRVAKAISIHRDTIVSYFLEHGGTLKGLKKGLGVGEDARIILVRTLKQGIEGMVQEHQDLLRVQGSLTFPGVKRNNFGRWDSDSWKRAD